MSEEENWQVKLADELHKPIKRNVSAKSLLTGRSLNPALKNRTSIRAYGNGLPQQRFTTVR